MRVSFFYPYSFVKAIPQSVHPKSCVYTHIIFKIIQKRHKIFKFRMHEVRDSVPKKTGF